MIGGCGISNVDGLADGEVSRSRWCPETGVAMMEVSNHLFFEWRVGSSR
jgi:hypothetical protein